MQNTYFFNMQNFGDENCNEPLVPYFNIVRLFLSLSLKMRDEPK